MLETHAVPQRSDLLPTNWDLSLPTEIVQLLQAMRTYALPNGRPNRKRVMQWAEANLKEKFFAGYGDLSATSSLWNYSLKDLGLSCEGWEYLNRKDKELRLPGPRHGPARIGRPPLNMRSERQTASATAKPSQSVAAQPSASASTHSPATGNNHDKISTPTTSAAQNGTLTPAPEQQIYKTWPKDEKARKLLNVIRGSFAGRTPQGAAWLAEEDELLIYLKEHLQLTWPEIGKYFVYRTQDWHGPQSHYSTKLNKRFRSTKAVRPEPMHESPASDEHVSLNQIGRKSVRLETSHAEAREYRSEDYFKRIFYRLEPEGSSSEDADDSGIAVQPSRIVRRSVNGAPIATDSEAARPEPDSTTASERRTFVTVTRRAQDVDELNVSKAALSGSLLKLPRKPVQRGQHVMKRRSIGVDRPYLTRSEQAFLSESLYNGIWDGDQSSPWHGATLHVDFTIEEARQIQEAIVDLYHDEETGKHFPIGLPA